MCIRDSLCAVIGMHRAEQPGSVGFALGNDAVSPCLLYTSTDGKHNRTGDDRRENLAQRLEEEAQHAFKDAADDEIGRAHV